MAEASKEAIMQESFNQLCNQWNIWQFNPTGKHSRNQMKKHQCPFLFHWFVSQLVSQFSEELFETSSLVTNLKMSHFVSWSVSNHLLERANIMKSSKQTQAKWQKCDISNWPSMEKWRTLVIKQWQINLCGQMTQTVKISESNGTALHAFLKICIQLCMTCRFSVKKV